MPRLATVLASPAAAQAEFEGRVQEILAGRGDAPQAKPAPASPARFVRFEGLPSPRDAPMEQAPELPAAEVEVIPSKAMPKLPPAGVARPNPYKDIRLTPPAEPSPEFVAAFDRQMASEREAPLFRGMEAADRAPGRASHSLHRCGGRLHRLADGPGRQGRQGQGQAEGCPFPLPPGVGQKGKGKGLGGEPFFPRARSAGRGSSRERRRDHYGKRSRPDRDEPTVHDQPHPCKKCGAWHVCRTAPENLARGAKHGHCNNPACVRSFGSVHGQDVPVRDRPTQPDCFIVVDDGLPGRQAEPKAPPVAAAALALAAGARIPRTPDNAHSDTDVSQSAPASLAPQIAAAAAAPPVARPSLLQRGAHGAVDWAAVRQMNEGVPALVGAAAARCPSGPHSAAARRPCRPLG